MDAGTEDCGELRRYIHLNSHLICSIHALKQKYKGKYFILRPILNIMWSSQFNAVATQEDLTYSLNGTNYSI